VGARACAADAYFFRVDHGIGDRTVYRPSPDGVFGFASSILWNSVLYCRDESRLTILG